MQTRSQARKEMNRNSPIDCPAATDATQQPDSRSPFADVVSFARPRGDTNVAGDAVSVRSESTASRSAATIAARKLAAEARLQRRRLERQQELALLADKADELEVQAELAALDGGSCSTRRSSINQWLEGNDAVREHTEFIPTADAPRSSNHINNIPDIAQSMADTAVAIKELALSQKNGSRRLEPILLPFFNGNPSQWLSFKRTFLDTKCNYSAADNVARLQHALRGQAKEAVATLLLSSSGPDEVMHVLEQTFARSEVIILQEINSLKNLPRLCNNLKDLGTFSCRVRNCVSTILLLNQHHYLYSPELFHVLLSKLDPVIKMRWADYAIEQPADIPKLQLLSNFLSREMDRYVQFSLLPDSLLNQSKERIHVVSEVHKDCPYCKFEHEIKNCSDFKALSVEDRWRSLKELRLCYRCLKGGAHRWNNCKAKPCGVNGCKRRHHALLHGSVAVDLPRTNHHQNSKLNTNNISVIPFSDGRNDLCTDNKLNILSISRQNYLHTYLKIVPITVSGPLGSYNTYALLDDGSTVTLIDSEVAAKIGVSGPEEQVQVCGVGGMCKSINMNRVKFSVQGFYAADTFEIENALSIQNLSLCSQTVTRTDISRYSHLADLSHVLALENAKPTILIGAEHWFLSITREVRQGKPSEPVACLTLLGWVLYGTRCSKTKPTVFINYIRPVSETDSTADTFDSLEALIKEQFSLDSIGILRPENLQSKQDQHVLALFEATARRLDSGRFEVGLPWRRNSLNIPNSYPQALRRFLNLEKKMEKDESFALSYRAFVADYVNKGFAEKCDNDHKTFKRAEDNVLWYLPHFAVYHPQKHKIRVVLDAAAKTNGISLNDMLYPGPVLLESLLGILFRFRERRVALSADIKEMFSQIKIRESDRDAQRFLWRDSSEMPIMEYRMSSVIFGAASSPCTALYIKNKNAIEFQDRYPDATRSILYDHYMDDYIGSVDSVSEAAQLAADIVTVHKSACFEMRGWISNMPTALSLIPEDLRAPQPSLVNLGDVQSLNSTKILGIVWNPDSDVLGFRTGVINGIPENLTKRVVLSHLMRVYDPLGFLTPLIIKGRIFFQETWRTISDWDTPLQNSLKEKWYEWFVDLSKVSNINIPRWYFQSELLSAEKELHMFSDASELAYACVAYWRVILSDGTVKISIIASKARVSPLKPVSIPRLELQAAVLASRLAQAIVNSHRIKPTKIFYWTDSSTVLSWLRNDARVFKPFVAHRVGEISENSKISDWRWVPGDLNVADDATRTIAASSLSISSRWFTGPSFLLRFPEDWPKEPSSLNVGNFSDELKVKEFKIVSILSVTTFPLPIVPNFNRFSCWVRLLRVTALALKAAAIFSSLSSRARIQAKASQRNVSATSNVNILSVEILQEAEKHILLQSQLDSFGEEYEAVSKSQLLPKQSRLKYLSPAIGEDRLLRLMGRIQSVSHVPAHTKAPVILDGKHPAVKLLIHYYHKKAAHANNELVVNEIRQFYWIINLRVTVRAVARSCQFCRIRKAQPVVPPIANLPEERLAHHHRPFTFTGLDYFGPVSVRVARRHEKRYVALFTCMVTRAVHLEVVASLSADSAIMSLRRFIARRGVPNTLFSDNGTAFVGANRQLKEFYAESVPQYAVSQFIKWKFIPPASPFFGGCWERLVRSVKVALSVTLVEKAPTEEVLHTFLLEAEALINSRPLTHVSVDPSDPETLTPFHFLLGCSSNQILPVTLDDGDLVRRNQWKISLRLADHFWTRWLKEVLPTMQMRPNKGSKLQSNLQVGDIVLVVDGMLPRGVWPKGRISAVFPGRDGFVRVADIQTQAGILRRPVKKLVKLPVMADC